MNKLCALYINEMIKIGKKLSMLIILIITVGVMAGFGILMRFTLSFASSPRVNEGMAKEYQTDNRNAIDSTLSSYEQQLAEIRDQMEAIGEGGDITTLRMEEVRLTEEMAKLKYFRDNDILFTFNDLLDFRIEAYNKLADDKIALFALEQKPQKSDGDIRKINAYTGFADKLKAAIDQNDISAYIAVEKERLDADETLTQEERALEKELLDLRIQMQPDKMPPVDMYYFARGQNMSSGLAYMRTLKTSLRDDVDYRSNGLIKPLNEKTRAEIKEDLAVAVYKVKNGISLSSALGTENASYMVLNGLMGIGMFGAIVLLIMSGGAAISSEISSGSIKSLIVAPVRRWKIVTAKLLSLITIWASSFLLVYALSILIKGLLYGFEPGESFVYAIGGKAFEMGNYLYHFAYLLLGFVTVFVYLIFAFMLSAITRNTAASVGITIGVYFAGSIITAFLRLFSARWADFLPFGHLELADRVLADRYTSFTAGSMLGGINLASNLPVMFSVIYLIILIFCMGYTAFDSFCRRDIK